MKAGSRFKGSAVQLPTVCILLFTLVMTVDGVDTDGKLPLASPTKLPRWRGFNLLEKFSKDWSNKPFVEEDFKLISELGFTFVRLPLDYRIWTRNGDWTTFDENVFRDIDRAVEWGHKYRVHVCINLHRAPGYCVNPPKERLDLWTNPEAQRVCAIHWAFFAKRYKGIPNSELSFDLLNEPSMGDGEAYLRVAKILVDAIRKEDPDRLVIADGLKWGTIPCFELLPLHIAQSTRGYSPMEISHYKASWIQGSDQMSVPAWPPVCRANQYLYGPEKKDIASPLVLTGSFPAGTAIRIKVNTVSGYSRLVVKGDDRPVFDKQFKCGSGTGEWEKVDYKQEWKVYQNIFNKNYSFTLPAAAKMITMENAEGDWLTLSEIGISLSGRSVQAGEMVLLAGGAEWGAKQVPVKFDPGSTTSRFSVAGAATGRQWLWKQNIEPWLKLEEAGSGVMVGEWGAFCKTPHDVALAWMKDCLANWKQAGWGWALWNFRGEFGILDSNRGDVKYEEFHGHKLDRKMLELLQKN